MASLDFPASPNNGDTFANWVYNSSKQAWQSKPLTPAKTVNSPTAPTSPADGDQWFNTNTGQLFIYFVDANGGQWVESRAPITADGYISPNYIINGAFDIWQRGTSATTDAGNTYKTADRWVGYKNNAGATESRQLSGLTGFQYCGRYQRNSGNTTTDQLWAYQSIETINSIPLAGKTVTLSFYARAGANYSAPSSGLIVQLRSGTGTDQNALSGFSGALFPINQVATLTTSWQRFSYTATLSPSITQLGAVFIEVPTGTAGANDWFEITGVQLEEGSVATPFRRNANSIQGELAACQRYYVRLSADASNTSATWGMGFQISSTSAVAAVPLPVTMRRVPDIGSDTVVGNLQWSDSVTYDRQLTGLATGQSTTSLQRVIASWSGSAGTAGYGGSVRSNATASGFLSFNAEL